MKWAVYNLLFAAVYPFLLPGFLMRMLRRGGYAARFGDRFALYPEKVLKALGRRSTLSDHHGGKARGTDDGFVWLHAVSVGEVQVAGQLMREWRRVEPGVRFCFSTTSSTGWKMAEREVGPNDVLVYNPLDFPNFVKSALLAVRPRAIVLTESEIWPNFIRRARRWGIPLFLINARVSDRSAPRYRLARWFFGDVFSCFTRIFAQSELDKCRLVAAGAPADRVDVTGSFKFDVARRNVAKEEELRKWLTDNGCEGRILLGGSTWPGEDEVLLKICEGIRNATLVIAPRHFEKADAVEQNILKTGFDCVRRSRPETNAAPSGRRRVYLADTTGELMGLYGLADVVFVGKSLKAHGSQNMIEPCLCGKPTFVGPYTENFRPVMSDLLESQAIVQVADEADLAKRISGVFDGTTDGEALGKRAAEAVVRRQGVVPKCVAAIRAALLAVLAGCSQGDGEKIAGDGYVFEPVRAAAAYVTLVEKPDVARVLLLGDEAKSLTNVFGRAKVKTSFTSDAPRFDALVIACGEMSRESCAKACSFVRDNGVVTWIMDVRDMTMDGFKERLGCFDLAEVHLWMPGSTRWLLTGRKVPRQIKLSAELELFSRAHMQVDFVAARCADFADVFASYVGTREEIMPAFDGAKGDAVVKPAFFLAKEPATVDWIVPGEDVDADIRRNILADIRSRQLVRRFVVEGDLAAELAKDKKDEEAVAKQWAKAYRRNPNDLLLLERLDRLDRNARGFLAVGKVLQAMKCYETMVLVRPNDAAAIHNFGMCLKKIGKLDLAKQVLKRAETLEGRK